MLRISWLAGSWWLVACLAGAPLIAAQAPAAADTTRARNLPAETRLQFTLNAAVAVQP